MFTCVVIFSSAFGYHDIVILGKCPTKWRQRPGMTMAVDWEVKPEINQSINKTKYFTRENKIFHSRKLHEKVQVGKDQEKAQSEKDSHSKNRGGKKTKLTIRYLYHETYRKPNEQLFSQ